MRQPVMIAKIAAVLAVFAIITVRVAADEFSVQPVLRPFYLVEKMEETELMTALQHCVYGPFYKTEFSIAHRGTPLQLSEHTSGSYEAAARMGAGILQCDVTLTSDGELVCCYAQCDRHTTTGIVASSHLSKNCQVPTKFNNQGNLANAADITKT